MNYLTLLLVFAIFALLLIIALRWKRHVMEQEYLKMKERENSYTFIYTNSSWGPEISAMVLNPSLNVEDFTGSDLNVELFEVTTSFTDSQGNTIQDRRPVAAACFCDIDGNEVTEDQKDGHIRLNFDVSEYHMIFSPFVRSEDGFEWKKDYECSISHPKFTEPVSETNDPIVPEEVKAQIQDMKL